MREILWYIGIPFRMILWMVAYAVSAMLGFDERDANNLKRDIWRKDG